MCPSSTRRSSLPLPQPRALTCKAVTAGFPTPSPAGHKVSRERGRPASPRRAVGACGTPPARALGRGVEYPYSCAECEGGVSLQAARLGGVWKCITSQPERVPPSLLFSARTTYLDTRNVWLSPEGLPAGRAADYASVQFSSLVKVLNRGLSNKRGIFIIVLVPDLIQPRSAFWIFKVLRFRFSFFLKGRRF